ncbi:complement C1q tumor necrosis factor-related protein 6-like [Mya arenaria]|uniref:complement C1q tumor necrosis factor-related protein 6-like n=1 Tax=Mya arenaria TaxID=6604 RepID=UPI0022DF2832|nr:complement C1q tumor necrosis factor-related protein 6-like [Mya arenaria]
MFSSALFLVFLGNAFATMTNEMENRFKEMDRSFTKRFEEQQLEIDLLKRRTAEQENEIKVLREVVKSSEKDKLQKRQNPFDYEVAFFAKVGTNLEHLGQGQTIVFGDVVTDIDSTMSLGAYNNSSGMFTAPIAGLYVFSTTMHSLNSQTTHFAIFRNSDKITTIYVHGDVTSDSTAQTVVLALKRGETISVRHIESDHGAYGGGHSLFSGFLLRAHVGEEEIVG